MSQFVLELLISNEADYVNANIVELNIESYVHKRVEKFIYVNNIHSGAIPIAYLENESLDANSSLQAVDKSWSVPANSEYLAKVNAQHALAVSKVVTSPYRDVLITNRTYIDSRGRSRALFYRHVLPANTIEANLYSLVNGNKLVVDEGYSIDLVEGLLYTNYQNHFNPETGAYKLFFIASVNSAGITSHQLLNPLPVAREADWSDIDLDTGLLKTDVPLYSREIATGGWKFYMNSAALWFLRPIPHALIQPIQPTVRNAKAPWYMKFTNGNFATVVNSAVRRYSVPEFEFQPFYPYKPYVYDPYIELNRVTRSVIACTRNNIFVSPELGFHARIIVNDSEGNLIRIFTTDESLDGVRFSNTNVFYEADKIIAWDNAGGFIALGVDVHASWTLGASLYYEAKDHEYRRLSLNPYNNRQAYDYLFVFYLVPDVNVADNAIHHLVVNNDGIIIECSQSQGVAHLNLQLLDSGGVYNPNTVIGLKYVSDVETDTFVSRYAAGADNNYGYMILTECSLTDFGFEEDLFAVDVQQKTGLAPESLEETLRSNQRILQSYLGYGEQGQEVPENSVMIVDAQLSLLADYGGSLTAEAAEELLRSTLTASSYAVINWVYPNVQLSGGSNTIASVDLSWTWEGPGLTYTLYRKTTAEEEWASIYSTSSPPFGAISYNDAAVISGKVYYYAVAITEDGIEFPNSDILIIQVR